MHNVPANVYGDIFIRNTHNLNLGTGRELILLSICIEIKGKIALHCHAPVFWNNLFKMNLKDLSASTPKTK